MWPPLACLAVVGSGHLGDLMLVGLDPVIFEKSLGGGYHPIAFLPLVHLRDVLDIDVPILQFFDVLGQFPSCLAPKKTPAPRHAERGCDTITMKKS
jgi:hypothetical protein